MATQPLMPKATAVWLVENTALTFDQIADFCKLHPLEVKAIADDGLADPNLSDNEKLLRFVARVPNPEQTLRPICEFAELIKEDLETKEALKLFYEDELSSTKWLLYACGALNAPQPGATARASA